MQAMPSFVRRKPPSKFIGPGVAGVLNRETTQMKKLIAAILATTALAGAAQAQNITEFRIGVLGGENAQDRLTSTECYRVKAEELLGVPVKVFTPADYDGVIQGLLGGTIDMAWLGASGYAKTYLTDPEAVEPVLVKVNTDGSYGYHSIGFARKDSGIASLEDMKDKKFGFGDPNSTSGYLIPSIEIPAITGKSMENGAYFGEVVFTGGHDHTPGQRQFRDLEKLRDYVQRKRGLSDAQFIEHIDTLRQLRQENGTRHEAATVAEAARLGAVLASHDDTTPKHVQISASYGVKVAEFPTTFEAAQACRDAGIAVMMGGPNLIRGGSHSGNVAAHALAEAGLLDIISSDYVPASLISSAFLLADLWGDLPRAIATVSATPAAAAGLADRGHLQVGLHADLVRVRRLDGHPCIRGVWSHGQQVG